MDLKEWIMDSKNGLKWNFRCWGLVAYFATEITTQKNITS